MVNENQTRNSGYIGPQERLAHILGYRPRDEQNIGMAWRGNKPETESLEVVKGIAEGMDFKLTTIARACIDLADGETASEFHARGALDFLGERDDFRVV